MDDPRDPFEAELASFQPAPLSPQVRRRIAKRLNPRPLRIALAWSSLAAAACAVVVVGIWASRPTTKHVKAPDIPTTNEFTARFACPPTVMDYRRAFDESPEALDALLSTGQVHRSNSRAATAVGGVGPSLDTN